MPSPPAHDPLEAAYRVETADLVRARMPYAVVYYLVASGALLALEWRHHPDRAVYLAWRDAFDVVLCLGALAAMRLAPRPPWPTVLAVAVVSWVVLANAAYMGFLGGQMERYVMVQVALLNLVVVLFPWGWRAQLVVAGASLTGYALGGPSMRSADAAAFCALILVVNAVVTVMSARFYDRYRQHGFVAQARAHQEAEIAAALYEAARALAPVERSTDVLEGVARIAMASLGCDWSAALRWDPHARAFRLAAQVGLEPRAADEIRQLEFNPEFGSAVGHLLAGRDLEIPDTSTADSVPPALMARWKVASLLAVPMRRGSSVVGVLAVGYRTRRGAFAERHRRLHDGLAQIGAVAVENVRLVTDLRNANTFKSEFVSTMSHELRTPLNVILGFTEMARDAALDAPEREHALDRVDVAARELFSLIEDTLEMGRIEWGRDGVRLQQVALRPLLAELELACVRLPRAPEVAFRWKADVPATTVLTDPRKLTVVVRNLVGNACKFTERGQVTVWVTMTEAQLVLTVSDTGVGIARADREAIFEMFRQGDSSNARRFGGLGLGLHIARRFVEQLGGTIEVSSEVGRGSVFSVKLPLAAVARSSHAA
ncbi:MAG TPA: GAF domain-containing sensor histidine kinase [Candidatus Limnocylindria bacterium]|nr:GAF domain-containing sensor histidine kinase [Candidatus Limnocylindria bacterium]